VSVSNDEIRQQLLKEEGQDMKTANALLQQRVMDTISKHIYQTTDDKGDQINQMVIYIDKNHSPSALLKLRAFLDEIKIENKNIIITKVCLTPVQKFGHSLKHYSFPFSLQLLLTCYLRVLNRQHHLTLTNENPELISRILFGFFNSFRNLAFDQTFKEKFGIDQFVEINLTNEDSEVFLPPNLTEIMNQCLLKCIKYPATPQSEPEFTRFVELVSKYRRFFGTPFVRDEHRNEILESLEAQKHQFLPSILNQERSLELVLSEDEDLNKQILSGDFKQSRSRSNQERLGLMLSQPPKDEYCEALNV